MLIGKFVVVRTYSAGVHMGTLLQANGTAAMLKDARRLWGWEGANTLHEISLHGVAENSKISEPVELIELTEVIEKLLCTEKAKQNLTRSRWK